MKKRIEYRQCTLRKRCSNSIELVQVSYIPAQFARLNQIVRLQDEDDQWSDGWRVTLVGTSVMSDKLPDTHRAVKNHRQLTGDSADRRR